MVQQITTQFTCEKTSKLKVAVERVQQSEVFVKVQSYKFYSTKPTL